MAKKRRASLALHPISVVAERTGLSPDVLRVWERRYAVVTPVRDDAGRRLYTDEHIERLRLLGQATAGGRSIGQLLELDADALSELVRSDEAARWQAPAPSEEGGESAFVERAFERTRGTDATGLEVELARAATLLGAGRFLERVIAPLFREIGDAWHAGELNVAQEHMATAVAHAVLTRVRASMPSAPDAPVVIVATPPGERHEIGALLAAGAAALEGWRVAYLGADLPAADIAAAAGETGARAVALSSVYSEDPAAVAAELRALREVLPPGVEVLLGGGGAGRVSDAGSIDGVRVLEGLGELRRWLTAR